VDFFEKEDGDTASASMDASGLFITLLITHVLQKKLHRRSHMVDTCINHLKDQAAPHQ
jgi:hypothetical protein